MIKILQVRNIDSFVESRRQKTSEKDRKTVQSILNDVRKNGDSAVKKYERKFNGRKTSQLRVSAKEIKEAISLVTKNRKSAIDYACKKLIQQQNLFKPKTVLVGSDSMEVGRRSLFVPIPSVGCYVPGGQARYPSSALMSIIPASIAGVKRIIVVSPPDTNGKIDPLTIYTAKKLGVKEIYKVGGSQAIGALAYGTKSIPKVDKIVGPGGKFVSIAKAIVSETTSIDMIAGPTELGIIADERAIPENVALDLISQAEHSNDTMCFVITTSKTLAKKVQKLLEELIPYVERSTIVRQSISKNGFIALCKDRNEVIDLANKIAPEHMEVMTSDANETAEKLTGPGLVLVGSDTPSSMSDYVLGTNHILPTNGFGRVRGGLSVYDFLKIQSIVETGLRHQDFASKYLKELTDAENLPNHYKAVKRRIYRFKGKNDE